MLGKTKESIKLFEKALEENEPHHLLYFNLALNYYNINDLANSEINAIKAIELNPGHPSSHMLLATIHDYLQNPVQTLLALHFFLLIEPNSARSPEAFKMLEKNFAGNVSKDSEDPNQINITLSADRNEEFSAAELMISMLAVSYTLEGERRQNRSRNVCKKH